MQRYAGTLKFAVIVLLIGLTAYYIVILTAKIKSMDIELRALGTEKRALGILYEREKREFEYTQARFSEINNAYELGKKRIGELNRSLQESEDVEEDLNSQISLLKAESSALRSENQGLKGELQGIREENDVFKKKMNSVAELKKAIREIRTRRDKTMQKLQEWLQEEEAPVPEGELGSGEGNKGFLIKDSQSTLSGGVKIEVEPAEK